MPVSDEAIARLMDYLDGVLTEAERARVEREAADSPDIRAALDRLRRLDARIEAWGRGIGEPRSADAQPERARPTTGPLRFPIRRVLAYAAVLVIGVGAWLVSQRFVGLTERPDPSALYRMVVARFEPRVICDTPEKFVAYTRAAYGRSITADFGSDTRLVGWVYPFDSSYTARDDQIEGPRVLLAEAPGGERVAVLFLTPDDWSPARVSDGSLRVHERRVAHLRVYEISTLDAPVVLGLLGVEDDGRD